MIRKKNFNLELISNTKDTRVKIKLSAMDDTSSNLNPEFAREEKRASNKKINKFLRNFIIPF